MGMFDTFWSNYTCPNCRKQVIFEEQVKMYGRELADFKLGDYIDNYRSAGCNYKLKINNSSEEMW